MGFPQVGEIDVGEIVAVVDQKALVEQVGYLAHRSGCSQKLGFVGVGETDIPLASVSEVLLDGFGEMVQVDDQLVEAVPGQEPDDVFEQGPAGDRDHGFGTGVGERAQARAPAGRQDHGFHALALRMMRAAFISCSLRA